MKVGIGPVFIKSQGMPQHILGIKKYSSHNVSLIPSNLYRTLLIKPPWKIDARIDLYKKFLAKSLEKDRLTHFDVLHSHNDPWLIDLCKKMRSPKRKWVHTYHSLFLEEDYPDHFEQWRKEDTRFLLEVASKADTKISVSKWLHDYLEEKYSVHTEVVFNGVDLDNCDAANPDKFAKKYGFKDFVLYVGYLDPIKNPYMFVELASRMPEVKFVMFGRDLDAAHLMSKKGMFIPRNLVFKGEVKHQDLLDAISSCKVLVMTSKREGCPTVLLEAMALGKPVVVPSHSGCKEIVSNKDYGFLYEPSSLDDLIEQTRRALESKNVGEKARERIQQNYDWKVLSKKIDLIYEN